MEDDGERNNQPNATTVAKFSRRCRTQYASCGANPRPWHEYFLANYSSGFSHVVCAVKPDRRLLSRLRHDAEAVYSPAYAAQYRAEDRSAQESETHRGKCEIIKSLSRRFTRPIIVLDLACGTGRYFHCAQNVKMLIGVDPSEHMLAEARHPVGGASEYVRLVRSTLQEITFVPQSFDLVFCIGVLGIWWPVDYLVLSRVADMLQRDGIFFFTTVEYSLDLVSYKRRIASAIRPLLFGAARRYVDARIHPFTSRETQVRALGDQYFCQVEIDRWHSPTGRVDLHCVMTQPRSVEKRANEF